MRIEITRRIVVSRRDPDEILRMVFGLREIELATFHTLEDQREARDVEAVARLIDRDRTTAQRSLCNLVSAGLVIRKTIPHSRLYYTYEAVPSRRLKDALREYLKEIYESLGNTIDKL